jgi:signal transduction histidine kinase
MVYITDARKAANTFPQRNHLSTSEMLERFYDTPCQNPVLRKSLALKRLNSIGNAGKTHYSELKRLIFYLHEELERKNKELEDVYNILSRIREEQALFEERSRIASDLHDNVLQVLFAVRAHLEVCLRQLSHQPSLYDRLYSIENMVNRAMTEIRQTVYQLSAIEPCPSLVKSVEALVNDLNTAGSTRIYLYVSGKEAVLPETLYQIAYRLVQESLVNALKHALATEIKVSLSFKEKVIELSVVDNGVGIPFDPLKEEQYQYKEKKFGLKNMLERIKSVKGTLTIQNTSYGKGTEVRALIPLQGA